MFEIGKNKVLTIQSSPPGNADIQSRTLIHVYTLEARIQRKRHIHTQDATSNAHNIAFEPILDSYICKCMVSTMESKNHLWVSKIVIPVNYWYWWTYKMSKYVGTWVVIWVDTTLYHIDTEAMLPRSKSSCMVYKPKQYLKQKIWQIPYHIGIRQKVNIRVEPNIIWYQFNTDHFNQKRD